jgi:hypothetical protein
MVFRGTEGFPMIEIATEDKMQEKQLMRPLSACVLVEVFYFREEVHNQQDQKVKISS